MMRRALCFLTSGLLLLGAGCASSKSGGKWNGDRPALDEVRSALLDLWQQELANPSPVVQGRVLPLSHEGKLRVSVFTGVPRLPDARTEAVTSGTRGGSRFVVSFRSATPPGYAIRHEAAHVFLLAHGAGGHPADFGKRHRLVRW